jgi:hypothetical protein
MKRRILSLIACLCILSTFFAKGVAAAHTCTDANRDYWCDELDCWIEHTCVDVDRDNWCDLCERWLIHDCFDENGDGWCDLCGGSVGSYEGLKVNVTATSYLNAEDVVKLALYPGLDPNILTARLTGNYVRYTFQNCTNRFYILEVSKKNHVSRDVGVDVGSRDVNVSVTICPIGDASLDGSVNVRDTAIIYAYARNTGRINDEYALDCADVNKDRNVNIGDAARVYAHVKGTKPLF